MHTTVRAAGTAALLIFAAFLLHNFNGEYYEPVLLGFEKPTDYANMAKIENAIWSFAFTSSGIAHMITGFAMFFLGLGLYDLFRPWSESSARLCLLAAGLSGLGFLLTGVSDIPGTAYGGILRDLNPHLNEQILMMTTLFRGLVNTVAIIGLGWLAGQVSWCARKSGLLLENSLDRWVNNLLGNLNVLPGLAAMALPVAGFIYLKTAPLWLLWLGLRLRRRAARG
jgi:hypothetical protein